MLSRRWAVSPRRPRRATAARAIRRQRPQSKSSPSEGTTEAKEPHPLTPWWLRAANAASGNSTAPKAEEPKKSGDTLHAVGGAAAAPSKNPAAEEAKAMNAPIKHTALVAKKQPIKRAEPKRPSPPPVGEALNAAAGKSSVHSSAHGQAEANSGAAARQNATEALAMNAPIKRSQ